jgi:hypothetical protein
MHNKPQCPTTIEWDRYISGVESERSTSFAQHLERCGYCRLALEERKQFLATISDVWNALGQSKVIYLHPLSIKEEIKSDYFPMAAMGETRDESVEGITLTSPRQEMLLKVLRDRHTNEVWLYLLADEASQYDHVIVKPFDFDREFITDSSGKINLGKIDWPKTDVLKAEVRFPEAVFELLPMTQDTPDRSGIVLATSRGDEIRVVFTGEQGFQRLDIEVTKLVTILEDTPLKVAIREAGSGNALHVRTLISARAEFDNVKSAEKLEIYLFQ